MRNRLVATRASCMPYPRRGGRLQSEKIQLPWAARVDMAEDSAVWPALPAPRHGHPPAQLACARHSPDKTRAHLVRIENAGRQSGACQMTQACCYSVLAVPKALGALRSNVNGWSATERVAGENRVR